MFIAGKRVAATLIATTVAVAAVLVVGNSADAAIVATVPLATAAEIPNPTMPLPRTGAPIGTTLVLAGMALALGALAVRYGHPRPRG